jgi:hypothetical protein
VVESIGLENRRTFGYRGFESHPACISLCDQLQFLFPQRKPQARPLPFLDSPSPPLSVLVVHLQQVLGVILKVVLQFVIAGVATSVLIVY